SPEAHHKALDLTRTIAADVEYWPTPDPTDTEGSREQRLDAYRAVREMLMARIKERFGFQPRGDEGRGAGGNTTAASSPARKRAISNHRRRDGVGVRDAPLAHGAWRLEV